MRNISRWCTLWISIIVLTKGSRPNDSIDLSIVAKASLILSEHQLQTVSEHASLDPTALVKIDHLRVHLLQSLDNQIADVFSVPPLLSSRFTELSTQTHKQGFFSSIFPWWTTSDLKTHDDDQPLMPRHHISISIKLHTPYENDTSESQMGSPRVKYHHHEKKAINATTAFQIPLLATKTFITECSVFVPSCGISQRDTHQTLQNGNKAFISFPDGSEIQLNSNAQIDTLSNSARNVSATTTNLAKGLADFLMPIATALNSDNLGKVPSTLYENSYGHILKSTTHYKRSQTKSKKTSHQIDRRPMGHQTLAPLYDQNGRPMGFNFGNGGGMVLPDGTTFNFGGGGGVYIGGESNRQDDPLNSIGASNEFYARQFTKELALSLNWDILRNHAKQQGRRFPLIDNTVADCQPVSFLIEHVNLGQLDTTNQGLSSSFQKCECDRDLYSLVLGKTSQQLLPAFKSFDIELFSRPDAIIEQHASPSSIPLIPLVVDFVRMINSVDKFLILWKSFLKHINQLMIPTSHASNDRIQHFIVEPSSSCIELHLSGNLAHLNLFEKGACQKSGYKQKVQRLHKATIVLDRVQSFYADLFETPTPQRPPPIINNKIAPQPQFLFIDHEDDHGNDLKQYWDAIASLLMINPLSDPHQINKILEMSKELPQSLLRSMHDVLHSQNSIHKCMLGHHLLKQDVCVQLCVPSPDLISILELKMGVCSSDYEIVTFPEDMVSQLQYFTKSTNRTKTTALHLTLPDVCIEFMPRSIPEMYGIQMSQSSIIVGGCDQNNQWQTTTTLNRLVNKVLTMKAVSTSDKAKKQFDTYLNNMDLEIQKLSRITFIDWHALRQFTATVIEDADLQMYRIVLENYLNQMQSLMSFVTPSLEMYSFPSWKVFRKTGLSLKMMISNHQRHLLQALAKFLATHASDARAKKDAKIIFPHIGKLDTMYFQ